MNVDSNEEDHDLGGKRDANIDQRQQRQNNNTNCLIVLTLKKHRDGIWITKLVERLKTVQQHEQQSNRNRNRNSPGPHIEIQVRALEDWFVEGYLVSDPPNRSRDRDLPNTTTIVGIINRVSDAAAPDLYKLCGTVLQVAEQLWHIPVWNGSHAYRLCGNKWCHHLLFRQAKLSSPTTLMYYTGDSTNNNDDDDDDNDRNTTEDNNKKTMNIDIDTQLFRRNRSSTRKHENTDDTGTNNTMELLIKPNSGGFGAGIQRLSFAVPSIASSSSSSSSSCIQTVSIPVTAAASSALNTDQTLLIQQYEPPHEGWIYRVWFLNGTIQCAIQRRIRKDVHHDDHYQHNPAEFTAGCAASATVGSTCRHNIPISSSSSSGSTNNCSSISSTEANNTNNTPATIAADRKHATAVPNHQHFPWKVPDDVRHEIEDQLLPLLPDAHCGSIEFLYAKVEEEEKEEVGTTPDPCRSPHLRRLYFDLNLLSTLPIIEDDDNNNNNNNYDSTLTNNAVDRDNTNPTTTMVWPKNYDPWLELAECIWEFVFRTTTTTN